MSVEFIARDKLTILFFLSSFGIPLTNTQITYFFTDNNIYNYFDLQQLLNENINTNLICTMTIKDRSLYTLTTKGKETLDLFTNRISKKLQKQIKLYACENKNAYKLENQLTSSYNKISDNDFETVCRVMEGNDTLIELKLNVCSAEQAKQICSSWKKKAPLVYKNIMETLITE